MALAAALILVWLVPPADDTAFDPREAEQVLQAAKVGTDTPSLLKFFKSRVSSPADGKTIQALIADLGAKQFTRREKAFAALLKVGKPARPFLRQTAGHPDPETARRALSLLEKIPADQEADLVAAAALLLAYRQAPAAGALLEYLPFVADDGAHEAVRAALTRIARTQFQSLPLLAETLADGSPVRRAAAAEALCRAGATDYLTAVADLAPGLPPALRLPVAVALTEAGRKEGVPLVIDLIPLAPERETWRAEDVLCRLAGDQAAAVVTDPKAKAGQVRAAWAAWWAKHGPTLDMKKLDGTTPFLNYTLVSQADDKSALGRVFEVGPNQQLRWEITNLRYPVDARVVGPNRVLIAEYLNRCVTERDFKGNVVWEYQIDLPIACQRLPNGNTFIATRRQLVEVTRDHKEVFSFHAPSTSIAAAQKLPNGHVVLVTGGQCLRLDAEGKVLHSFAAGLVYNQGGGLHALPNGRVLIPEYRAHRVVEYDKEGNVLREFKAASPSSVSRLPNGHTLVVSLQQQMVLEFDRDGRQISATPTDGRPWRVLRR